MFAGGDFATYYGDDDASHLPASIEGGDVHVLGHGAVLIGMGERTTPMAVEILARALFAGGPGHHASSPSSCRKSHAMMHLDTVMTMIDSGHLRALPLPRPAPAVLDAHPRPRSRASWPSAATRSLWAALAQALGVDEVTVLTTDEDIRAAEREQWDDGNNYLAVAPGVDRRLRAQRRHQHHAAQARHRGRHRRRRASSAAAAAARAA